ncbi:MAG: protein tyrosine phosphatase family protein [Rhodothermales bacterium]
MTPEITPDALLRIRAFRAIDERLATSGQITYDDIAALDTAGFDLVINLAPADPDRYPESGWRIVQRGMAYVHIPVSWEQPDPKHLDLFFDILAQNRRRKVFVHCIANKRVSTFVYLYRTLREGVADDVAKADMHAIWDPESLPQWKSFVAHARPA